MISTEEFKLLLQQIKVQEKLNQSEIASKLGVKSTYLSDMANGRVPVTESVIKGLSELFHIKCMNQSISGNVISHSTVTQDNRSYYSDSPDVLRAEIDKLDRIIEEKEERIKEKDAQIKEKDAQIKEKDAQIKTLLEILKK